MTDPTTREGLSAILDVARDAAHAAAELASGGFRRELVVEHKGAVDLVTNFDRDSETLLRERLSRALPFPIVGEEQGGASDAASNEAVLYIDPIDGTTNFVHGHPFWCVSVGLVLAGTPILGVVVAPALGLEWNGFVLPDGDREATRRSAVLRAGSVVLTSEACTVSPTPAIDASLLATGFPYDRRTSDDNNFDAFVALKRRCQAVRRCGSAAIDLCLVADGTYEGYWERKLHPWDVAAGIAIVHAAGGIVTDYDGVPSTISERSHVVATNGLIHRAILHELAAVSRPPPPR